VKSSRFVDHSLNLQKYVMLTTINLNLNLAEYKEPVLYKFKLIRIK